MKIRVTKVVERDEVGKVIVDEDIKYALEVQVKDLNLSLNSVWFCGKEGQIKERVEALRKAFIEYTGVDDPDPVFEERTIDYGKMGQGKEPKRGKASGASRRGSAGAGRGSQASRSGKGRRDPEGNDAAGRVKGGGQRGQGTLL